MTREPGADVPAPLARRLPDARPAAALFAEVAGTPGTVWLDGGDRTFLACDPFAVLRAAGGRGEWLGARPDGRTAADPLSELEDALRRWRIPAAPDLPPFPGGAAGSFGYELAGTLERLPPPAERPAGIPDLELGFYDALLGWDDRGGWVVSTGQPERGPTRGARAAGRLETLAAWACGRGPPPAEGAAAGAPTDESGPGPAPDIGGHPTPWTGLRSDFSEEGYRDAVARAVEYVRAGDVYQVNLSQRLEGVARAGPLAVYRHLRRDNPAAYGGVLRGGGSTIVSASPERFLGLTPDGRLETRPIKGTRPRGADPDTDRRLAAELRASAKDRAENLMIADLLRNDLSRVCRPGTVRAEELFRLVTLPTVHHLVSRVTGRLREGAGPVDCLRAAFPSGSVTGAPKIRAMEVIRELEPVPRGPYCGALGWIGFDGSMDTAVGIRLLVFAGDRVYLHAGGAVVADSEPEAERRETLDKAAALARALAAAEADG